MIVTMSNHVESAAGVPAATAASRASSAAASASARTPSATSTPLTLTRSFMRSTCGDAYRPTRRPARARPAATSADTDPLPLVPPTCTHRSSCWGSPSRPSKSRTGSSRTRMPAVRSRRSQSTRSSRRSSAHQKAGHRTSAFPCNWSVTSPLGPCVPEAFCADSLVMPMTPLNVTHPFLDADGDKLREECGIFGAIRASDASATTALGLHALQHRGQEAAGIVSYDGKEFYARRGLGHVAENFTSSDAIASLPGHMAAGHVRYWTTGGAGLRNVQPLYADLASGGFAVAHNGNISNAMTLRTDLVNKGSIFQSTSDTEVIIHLVATSRYPTIADRLVDALRQALS